MQDCIIWGGTHKSGYGIISDRLEGRLRRFRAHRRAWELLVGPLTPGEDLHHLCEQRDCVNPFHLRPLSPGEHAAIHNRTRFLGGCPRCGASDWVRNGKNGLKRRCRPCRNAYQRTRRALA